MKTPEIERKLTNESHGTLRVIRDCNGVLEGHLGPHVVWGDRLSEVLLKIEEKIKAEEPDTVAPMESMRSWCEKNGLPVRYPHETARHTPPPGPRPL